MSKPRAIPTTLLLDGKEVTSKEFNQAIRERLIFRAVILEWLEEQIMLCDDNDLPSPDYWFSRARALNDVVNFVNEYTESEAK